jgi:hypothetical protein
MIWQITHKGDQRCRILADCHYTRQTPGNRQFTRPGYNFVLYYPGAVYVWWRPKWEAGIERQDRLRAIECTIFRNTTQILSSTLIREATDLITSIPCINALKLRTAGPFFPITAVVSKKTERGRSRNSLPGACYRYAGWTDFSHKKGLADTWLYFPHHYLFTEDGVL